jgi:hypothetical protein
VRNVAAHRSTGATLEIPSVQAKPAACNVEAAAVALATLYSAQLVRVTSSGLAAALGPTLTCCVPMSETLFLSFRYLLLDHLLCSNQKALESW